MARQKAHLLYNVDKKAENLKRNNQVCPRCSGSFLGEHKNRRSCGQCGYSEYKR
ncbi:MAG: 30S ribosomal protein S27ae [Candidatus Hodarchaeales archaeon]|jgi:small subunit ribosomal protein S27Ae